LALAEPPAGLLAVDHRPTQPTCLMIGVERRKVVAMSTAERGVLLEQPFLHVETEMLRLGVFEACLEVLRRVLVDLAVLEKNIEQGLAAIARLLSDQVFRPDFFDLEALRELHELPQV